MLTRKALLVSVLCSVVFLCPLAYSQANGSLSGTVADKTGSVITGATVKITSPETGLSREARTDDSGHYLVPVLPVATYIIHVEAQGFQTSEQRGIRLQVNEQREVNFSLNPASVSQSVEVNANEVAVETTNPTLGQVINEEQVARLPLNGRDFVQLASLTPGAVQETNPGSFFTRVPTAKSRPAAPSLCRSAARAIPPTGFSTATTTTRLTAAALRILLDRRHPGVQSSHLQLLRRIRHARGPDRAGHHQVRLECIPRIAVRVLPQYRPGCPQGSFASTRRVQPESVRRIARRPDPER